MMKFMSVIQSEGCANPMLPVGPSLINCSLKLTLGKTNIGGIEQCCPTFLTPRAAQDIIMKTRAAPVNSNVTTKIC